MAIFISILTWTISHGCGVATRHNVENTDSSRGWGTWNRAVGRSQTIGPHNAEARPPAGFVQLDEP